MGEKLLPNGKHDSLIDVCDGFADLTDLFGEHYQAHLVQLKSLKKNNSRFMVTMKNWAKKFVLIEINTVRFFLPPTGKIWMTLLKKYTIICNECPKLVGHGMFPSITNKYKKERMENLGYAAKEAKKNSK